MCVTISNSLKDMQSCPRGQRGLTDQQRCVGRGIHYVTSDAQQLGVINVALTVLTVQPTGNGLSAVRAGPPLRAHRSFLTVRASVNVPFHTSCTSCPHEVTRSHPDFFLVLGRTNLTAGWQTWACEVRTPGVDAERKVEQEKKRKFTGRSPLLVRLFELTQLGRIWC